VERTVAHSRASWVAPTRPAKCSTDVRRLQHVSRERPQRVVPLMAISPQNAALCRAGMPGRTHAAFACDAHHGAGAPAQPGQSAAGAGCCTTCSRPEHEGRAPGRRRPCRHPPSVGTRQAVLKTTTLRLSLPKRQRETETTTAYADHSRACAVTPVGEEPETPRDPEHNPGKAMPIARREEAA